MKFIKIETNHTQAQIDEMAAGISSIQSDRIESLYKQMSWVQYEDDNGFVCVFFSIPDRLVAELLDIYVSMSVDFRYFDLTKDALYRKIDVKGFGLIPDKLSQLDYILETFIDENLDMNTVLEKVFEMGEKSLTEKDILVLQSL